MLPRGNVKLFNSVEELWAYCLFCPICKNPDRFLDLTAGPDDHFKIEAWKKVGTQLQLDCGFRHDRKDKKSRAGHYKANYVVDCQQNTYHLSTSGPDSALAEKAAEFNFFFHVYAKCKACYNSSVNTTDIEFDDSKKLVYNMEVDRESVYLLEDKDKYHITLSHDRNVMMVSRCSLQKETIIDEENVIDLPLINLDFSNPTKIVNKIKTLILFS